MMKKKYTNEFKLQALELVNQLGSYAAAARQLGIKDTQLHNWKAKFKFVLKKDTDAALVDLAGLTWSRFNVNLGLNERGQLWVESIIKQKRLSNT